MAWQLIADLCNPTIGQRCHEAPAESSRPLHLEFVKRTSPTHPCGKVVPRNMQGKGSLKSPHHHANVALPPRHVRHVVVISRKTFVTIIAIIIISIEVGDVLGRCVQSWNDVMYLSRLCVNESIL